MFRGRFGAATLRPVARGSCAIRRGIVRIGIMGTARQGGPAARRTSFAGAASASWLARPFTSPTSGAAGWFAVDDKAALLFAKLVQIVAGMLFIEAFFYTYTGAFGFENVLVDIVSFVVAMVWVRDELPIGCCRRDRSLPGPAVSHVDRFRRAPVHHDHLRASAHPPLSRQHHGDLRPTLKGNWPPAHQVRRPATSAS